MTIHWPLTELADMLHSWSVGKQAGGRANTLVGTKEIVHIKCKTHYNAKKKKTALQ